MSHGSVGYDRGKLEEKKEAHEGMTSLTISADNTVATCQMIEGSSDLRLLPIICASCMKTPTLPPVVELISVSHRVSLPLGYIYRLTFSRAMSGDRDFGSSDRLVAPGWKREVALEKSLSLGSEAQSVSKCQEYRLQVSLNGRYRRAVKVMIMSTKATVWQEVGSRY